jgi:hypothetical protein
MANISVWQMFKRCIKILQDGGKIWYIAFLVSHEFQQDVVYEQHRVKLTEAAHRSCFCEQPIPVCMGTC